MDNVDGYNPYATRLTESDILKLNLVVSGSTAVAKYDETLHVGGAGLRKLGNDEAKKSRRV
jgi:hypothetical protein